MKTLHLIFIFFYATLVLLSCDNEENLNRQFRIFKGIENNTTVEMDGTLSNTSLDNFNALETLFP